MSPVPTEDGIPAAEAHRQHIKALVSSVLQSDDKFTVMPHPGSGPGHDTLLVEAEGYVFAVVVRKLDVTVRGEKIRLTYWRTSDEEGGRK